MATLELGEVENALYFPVFTVLGWCRPFTASFHYNWCHLYCHYLGIFKSHHHFTPLILLSNTKDFCSLLCSSSVVTQSTLNFKGILKFGLFEIVCGNNCLVMLSMDEQLVSTSALWQMDFWRWNNARSCQGKLGGAHAPPGRHWESWGSSTVEGEGALGAQSSEAWRSTGCTGSVSISAVLSSYPASGTGAMATTLRGTQQMDLLF